MQPEPLAASAWQIADVLTRYNDQPHAGSTRKVRKLMDEFRSTDSDQIAADPQFMKKMTSLEVNLKSQNGTDSRQMYQSLMARKIPGHFDHISVEVAFQEQMAFDKKYGL
jgi:hypothetical protein